MAAEQRVTSLELFFDLVFVFAITQVTGLMSADPTWPGLVRGLLVLGALWWAWVAYAWLTNTVNPDEGGVRLAVFGAMAALLVVSIAVPGAFGDDALLFALAYAAVRALHVVLYAVASRRSPDLRGAVLRLAPGVLIAPVFLIVAAFLDGIAQGALWVAALALDYLAPVIAGTRGWAVSPGHFAERHGLIVIIALGESIVAVGAGAAGLPIDAGLVSAGTLGLIVAAALWWAYFDIGALVGERRLHALTGTARTALARDAYSYLHLPLVAGIVLFALGVKKTLGHVGDPLHAVPATAMLGGVALFLLGHVAFRLRVTGSVNRWRAGAAAVCLVLIPAALAVPALVTLAVLALLVCALIALEVVRHREVRTRLRSAASG